MTIPTVCQPLAATVEELEQERRGLQAELQVAPTGQKARLATAIKALTKRIGSARDDLTDCLATADPPPPEPSPMDAVLAGVATLSTSSPHVPDPIVEDVKIGLVFDGSRTFVGITSFPPITRKGPTPLGDNTTSVTKTGYGAGSHTNGQIVLPVKLHFDNDVVAIGDWDLVLTLATFPHGSAITPAGAVTITGSGTFSGGILEGSTGTLTVAGVITPVP